MDKLRLSNWLLACMNFTLLILLVWHLAIAPERRTNPVESAAARAQIEPGVEKPAWVQAYEKYRNREIGFDPNRVGRVNHPLLIGGKISDQALNIAGVDSGEKDYILALVKSTIGNMAKLQKAAISETGSTDGVYSYKIPPIPEGQVLLDRMKGDLQKKYGLEAGNLLFNNFDPNHYLGEFGKLQVEMELVPDPAKKNAYSVRYKTIDLDFSKVRTNDVMSLDNFNEVYGDLFQMD